MLSFFTFALKGMHFGSHLQRWVRKGVATCPRCTLQVAAPEVQPPAPDACSKLQLLKFSAHMLSNVAPLLSRACIRHPIIQQWVRKGVATCPTAMPCSLQPLRCSHLPRMQLFQIAAPVAQPTGSVFSPILSRAWILNPILSRRRARGWPPAPVIPCSSQAPEVSSLCDVCIIAAANSNRECYSGGSSQGYADHPCSVQSCPVHLRAQAMSQP